MSEPQIYDVTATRKDSLDFFEQVFVDAFLGDIPKTLAVLKAVGVTMSAGYANRIFSRAKVIDAIKERGEHPIREALYLNVQELQALWTQIILNSSDDKIRLKSSELLGKSQGAFIEKKEITLKNHEFWLGLLNKEPLELQGKEGDIAISTTDESLDFL